MIVVGSVAGVLSAVFFMPYVYRRYETTVALPIEYGALNACTVLSGLLFYDEHLYMRPYQLALQITGTCIILLGIALGRLPERGAPPQPSVASTKPQF